MSTRRLGFIYGIAAYLCWGAFPLFFMLLAAVDPFEAVPWRVITALGFCVIAVTVVRSWGSVLQILRSPRMLGWFALCTVLLYANWQIFVFGIVTGHIIETSLGYFINPLFTVFIGVVFRRETLTRLQWIAIAIAGVGVLVAAIAYGRVPWIALGLAVSFGLYGAVHKKVGESIDGVTGLTVETLTTLPVALIQLAIVSQVIGLTAFSHGPWIGALVLWAGVMTGIPLILFGEAARRLKLSYLGFVQFLTPILGFLYGYFVMHEAMPAPRWIGFVSVWIALVILMVDVVIQLRKAPDVPPTTGPIRLD